MFLETSQTYWLKPKRCALKLNQKDEWLCCSFYCFSFSYTLLSSRSLCVHKHENDATGITVIANQRYNLEISYLMKKNSSRIYVSKERKRSTLTGTVASTWRAFNRYFSNKKSIFLDVLTRCLWKKKRLTQNVDCRLHSIRLTLSCSTH